MDTHRDDELPTDELDDPRLAPSTFDAVVFDLGNVLIRWDPLPAIAAGVGEDRARALLEHPTFDFAAWNHAQDAGRTWAEGEQAAIEEHPDLADELLAYRPNFGHALIGPIDDSVAVLRDLHQAGVPLFALTNWSEELFPAAVERFDFLELFEDIIVSGEEGAAKPDPEIFEVLEGRLRHRGSLDDSVFIDDSAANVLTAEGLGMDAIHFTGPGHLREDLRVRGLPLPS